MGHRVRQRDPARSSRAFLKDVEEGEGPITHNFVSRVIGGELDGKRKRKEASRGSIAFHLLVASNSRSILEINSISPGQFGFCMLTCSNPSYRSLEPLNRLTRVFVESSDRNQTSSLSGESPLTSPVSLYPI